MYAKLNIKHDNQGLLILFSISLILKSQLKIATHRKRRPNQLHELREYIRWYHSGNSTAILTRLP